MQRALDDAKKAGMKHGESGVTQCHARKIEIDAMYAKAEGDVFVKAGKFPEAVVKYSEALALDSTMHKVYSNRAYCYEKMKVRIAATVGRVG